MTKKELLQENEALRELLFKIRNRIDAKVEELDEGADDPENEEEADDDD